MIVNHHVGLGIEPGITTMQSALEYIENSLFVEKNSIQSGENNLSQRISGWIKFDIG